MEASKTEHLKSLYSHNVDAARGYRMASQHVDSQRLASAMSRASETREANAADLKALITGLGESADGGSFKASMHRAWIAGNSSAGASTEFVVNECLRGEQQFLSAYTEALSRGTYGDYLNSMLKRQLADAQKSVSDLRRFRSLRAPDPLDRSKDPHPVAIATYESTEAVHTVLRALRDHGISPEKIGILGQDAEGARVKTFADLMDNRSGEGAVTGLAAGAASGAVWALGIAFGAIPALGPVVAGGIFATLATAAATTATGTVIGTLIGMGYTDEEAAYYAEELQSGRTLISVDLEKEDRARIWQILTHGK